MTRLLLFVLLASVTSARAQSFWFPADGPYGGNAYRMVQAPGGEIYVAGSAGVFRSIDDGITWSQTGMLPFLRASINASPQLVVTRGGTVLMVALGNQLALFRSQDRGLTWQQISDSVAPGFKALLGGLALDSATGDVYVSDLAKVYRSSDDGMTWQATDVPAGAAILQVHGGDVYLQSERALIRFAADSPTVADTIPVPPQVTRRGLVLYGGDPIIDVIDRGMPTMAISADRGRSWRLLDSSAPLVRVRVGRNGELFALGNRVGRSTDGGMTWTILRSRNDSLSYEDVLVTSTGTLLSTTSFGIDRSTDGGATWTSSNNGFAAQRVAALAARPGGGLFSLLFGVDSRIRQSFSQTGVNAWRTAENLGGSWWLPIGYDDEGILYVPSQNELAVSSDDGATWTRRAVAGGRQFLGLATASDTLVALAYPGRFYASADDGITWSLLPPTTITGSVYTNLGYAPDGSLLFGNDSAHYRSTDGGTTWTRTELVARMGHYQLGRDGNVYMRSGDGVFRSPNGYSDWVQIYRSQGTQAPQLAIGNGVLVVLDGSLYISRDNGSQWFPVQEGLEGLRLLSLAATEDGRFYVGTNGQGIYHTDPLIGGADDDIAFDRSMPSVTLSTSGNEIAVRGACEDASLSIVDALGSTVGRGVGKAMSVDGLPSGVYFVRVECGAGAGVPVVHVPVVIRR